MLPGHWGTTTSYVMNHAARTATTRQSIARVGRAANGGGKERRGGERETGGDSYRRADRERRHVKNLA